MDSSQTSNPSPSLDSVLPPGFLSVKQFQELPSSALKQGHLISIIGFLKDFQPPYKTSGTDFKCTFEIKDSSVQCQTYGVKVNIFWPPNHMPNFGAGDAVIVRNAKAQMRDSRPSLLTNVMTEIHVLSASQIPSSSTSPKIPWRSYPPRKAHKLPTSLEISYVVDESKHITDLALLSTMEFQERSEQAMNIKEKFALLKDVQSGHYYDLIGQVLQVYDAPSGQMTLHLSDYTANSEFYNHVYGEGEPINPRDGDEYNYIKQRPKPAKDWPGPYGKMSIQLTLFDEHASFAREEVETRAWVLLRNVRIAYGKMGGCLEGFLHHDDRKVNVEVITESYEVEEVSRRWKEAVSRKRELQKKIDNQKQRLHDENSGNKRKCEDESVKQNSKARRKEKRARVESKLAAKEQKLMVRLDLNENIRCENLDQPAVLLTRILEPRTIADPKDPGREYRSPFDTRKYRANLRIVGFFPPKVEDFSVGRRPSEFDILSDYSGDEDTDPEENMRAFRSGKGSPEKNWEWRFALQVVDASDKLFTERVWVVVSNYDGQMLFDMDATDLRRNKEALYMVKERLCILWGDLEEQTAARERANKSKTQSPIGDSPRPSSYHPGDQPPIDSDDERENEETGAGSKYKPSHPKTVLGEGDANAGSVGPKDTASDAQSLQQIQFTNKAFTCCIRQYGVKIKEDDPALANAGNGMRWERKFGLFGTKIL